MLSRDSSVGFTLHCNFYGHNASDELFRDISKIKVMDVHPTLSWVVTVDEVGVRSGHDTRGVLFTCVWVAETAVHSVGLRWAASGARVQPAGYQGPAAHGARVGCGRVTAAGIFYAAYAAGVAGAVRMPAPAHDRLHWNSGLTCPTMCAFGVAVRSPRSFSATSLDISAAVEDANASSAFKCGVAKTVRFYDAVRCTCCRGLWLIAPTCATLDAE